MSKPTLEIKDDFMRDFNDLMNHFKRDAVLIGIPATETNRDEDEEAGINNAALLAIQSFGSPINNIPARPVLYIGIRNAQEAIAEQFKNGFKLALTKGLAGLEIYYNRLGIIASNACKKVINEQDGISPPADSTLAQRKRDGFRGTKALVRSGQMRNAITYVINKGGF